METVGGRYALDARLGEGGMGQVWRARHLQLGKQFALKIISAAFADDTAARARFNQEAKLASEISHPNIVSVVDFGEDPRFGAYMVMELVEGEPLFGDGTLPMSVRRACDVLGQVADALDHIHKRGIVHGDVKAENIMLAVEADGARRRRIVRLLDFGLARRHDEAEELVSGSPHYLAPERASGGQATVSTDLYALGCLGYLLFTGTLPFDGSVVQILMAQIHEPHEPMSKRRGGEPLDPAIEQLIARALEKDPSMRHPSAAAFRYELNTVMHMLDMAPRKRSGALRAEATRDAMLIASFERSRLPQAIVQTDGMITTGNAAFAKLIGRDDSVDNVALADTPLAAFVPGLVRAIRGVHDDGKPAERRAHVARPGKAALELVVWLAPLPIAGNVVHLLVRVEEKSA